MAAAASAAVGGGGGGDPAAIAAALTTPLSVTQTIPPSLDIANYNQVCSRVTSFKQILVRNADTIHDFGGARGQVPEDDGREYTRIEGLILAEKETLNARYAGILAKYNNLTQGSNFEDTMFRGLLPPQVTFVYGNTPGEGVDPTVFTRLEIRTDAIQDVSAAKIARNLIYRFLWNEEVVPGSSFSIMADVSPGNEIKKIATVTGDDPSVVKIRVRVTPESVMDAGPTYNVNNDKILPGFGEFVASPLDGKPHPTPVYSLPSIRIHTRVRDGYGVNNPKAFDVVFTNIINSETLTIPHDDYDSGPGVEYIARNAAGFDMADVKAGMLPFYNLIRNEGYRRAAQAVGLLNADGTLTDLGKNIGYDLKRDGDQSQAIAVLLSYLKEEKVVLATQDRMLALFMILMGGPVIHVGNGKTTIYRGEPVTMDTETRARLERARLIRDIQEVTAPFVNDTLLTDIFTKISSLRSHISNMVIKYRSNTGKLLLIPYMLLMKSVTSMIDGINRLDADYRILVYSRESLRIEISGLESKSIDELRLLQHTLMVPVSDATLRTASVTSAIESLTNVKHPIKKLNLGKYGYIDLPSINSLNKVINRFITTAKTGFRSDKIFESFKDAIVSKFEVVYSKIPIGERGELTDIETGLHSITKDNYGSYLGIVSQMPITAVAVAAAAAKDGAETVDTDINETASAAEAAARGAFAEAVAGTPSLPDIKTVTNINTAYDFCVRVVDVLYSTIQPLIMLGKGRADALLSQVGGVKDIESRVTRRVKEFHRGMVPEERRAKRDAASKELMKQKRYEMVQKRRLEATKYIDSISQIVDDAVTTLEFKIYSLIDDTYIPIDIAPVANEAREWLVKLRDVLLSSELPIGKRLRILQTMRGILVEGDPEIQYDNLYNIYALPAVLTALFEACTRSAFPDPFDLVDSFGRKSMPSQTKRHRRKCPRGTIRRKGYTTKRGVTVRSSCIKDRGLPGKGKRLFTLKKGELGKYGYSLKQTREKRRIALEKARKEIPHATLVRKVNALAILMKNTHPKYSKRARADVKWLGKTRS